MVENNGLSSIYSGTGNYIFASYAHEDADLVMPILQGLSKKGLQIWYDKKLETGDEWITLIARKIANAAFVVAFISPAFVKSRYSDREIHSAFKHQIPIIPIYIRSTELSESLDFILDGIQYYDAERQTLQQVISEIMHVKDIDQCKDQSTGVRQHNARKRITPQVISEIKQAKDSSQSQDNSQNKNNGQSEDASQSEDHSSVMKQYQLIDENGMTYSSSEPGVFDGHKKLKIYGRLDCPAALRYIAKGQYVQYRVFFADEATAIKAGYRPCGSCMKEEYRQWKQMKAQGKEQEWRQMKIQQTSNES